MRTQPDDFVRVMIPGMGTYQFHREEVPPSLSGYVHEVGAILDVDAEGEPKKPSKAKGAG